MTPERWLEAFSAALATNDAPRVTSLFAEECYWRDLVAFTWNIKTCEGRAAIGEMLKAVLPVTRPAGWKLQQKFPSASEGWFDFETAAGRGIGHFRLRDGKCWTLLTALRELKGFEERSGRTREQGVQHGAFRGRKSWLEQRQEQAAGLGHTRQPYVLIVGGGQGGIGLAARLKRLGVPTLVIEKNARAGDSWRRRYRSLCLHDPVWYDHMPYLPFPQHWPVFSPKDKIGDWLQMYVTIMELDYWSSTECLGARYDNQAQEWQVSVLKENQSITLRAKQLVLATGMSGYPTVPDIPGAASFAGTLRHSSRHPGSADYAGRHCVILGANTSAHDICADLWEHGAASVTMVQRAPTIVATSEALKEHAWGKLYSEEAVESGITTDIADLTVASVPYKVTPALQQPVYEAIRKRDAKLYEGLAKAGFLFDFGADGSGIHTAYLRRGAGYYIEVGASQLIVDGGIRLKSGVSFERINERSVTLTDGTELAADLIVYATGYGSMNEWAEKLISKEVADRVGKCWGLGSDTKYDPGPWVGELRNMWKPTRQPGLWFHGGNLMQSRHYSLYLALQLKARMEDIPTPVFGMDEVTHLR